MVMFLQKKQKHIASASASAKPKGRDSSQTTLWNELFVGHKRWLVLNMPFFP